MCGIFGSSNQQTFIELVALNSYRGNHTHTITNSSGVYRDYGPFTAEVIRHQWRDGLHIGHIQAPTNGEVSDLNRSHPSVYEDTLLWHNGIVTERCIKQLARTDEERQWDTKIIHRWVSQGFENLVHIDGTFSCVLMNQASKRVFLFRNSASPMFVDSNGSFSSVKFDGSGPTKPNTIYEYTPNGFDAIGEFVNNSSPYFFI